MDSSIEKWLYFMNILEFQNWDFFENTKKLKVVRIFLCHPFNSNECLNNWELGMMTFLFPDRDRPRPVHIPPPSLHRHNRYIERS